jgi:N-acetylglucosaminyldiphosphoundecaprenol N-acetyl-beta-D-mannosaminyltransferase
MTTSATPHTRGPISSVLGVPIDALSTSSAIAQISTWAQRGESRTVCICNVHSVVTAGADPRFMAALRSADMATPDGAPVAWMLRVQGHQHQRRISGPDLMWAYMDHAARNAEPVFLLGSTAHTLARLQQTLQAQWPTLQIAGALSPPFRPATPSEDQAMVQAINQSGARTVWVSLGCPKQELWMHAHRQQIHAVMLGVGAAFDFHAGTMKRAPAWMQNSGLEWLHRLASEPGRLWRRYLVGNSIFVMRAAWQLLRPRA